MANSTQTWQLFVDESGDFDKPDDDVAVAGVLMRAYDSSQLRTRLEHALRRIVPLGSYPPHASRLNIPATLALAGMIHVAPGRDGAWFKQRVLPAVEAITSSAEAPALKARKEVERVHLSGGDIDWDVTTEVDGWLRDNHPRAHRALRQLAADIDGGMVELLALIENQCLDGGMCFVVGAWSQGGEHHRTTAADRYLTLLETLLERTFTILAADRLPTQVLHVQIATRRVEVAGSVRPMLVTDVGDAVRSAGRFPVGLVPPYVEFFPHPPAHYGRDVHPGIVLADFVANRMLRRVLRGGPDWGGLRTRAAGAIGLPVSAVPRSVADVEAPAIAADGVPRRVIHNAFAGGGEDLVTGEVPRWANEQAHVWVKLAQLLQVRKEGAR